MISECCGKRIDEEEYTLNHGMCHECMDKGVEEANQRQMCWERFEKVEIGLNHATTETESKDVIYIEQGEENHTNGIIAITVEEAEWLAEKLIKYANKFKK